jgi:hypothetical protein
MIRRRGNSFQAILFAGTDPVTGRQLYLRGSSTDEVEAKKILRHFKAQVAEQRHAKTRASLGSAIASWLETHELEESTGENYVRYAERHIYPVFGEEPIGKVTTHVLERLYAELRRRLRGCRLQAPRLQALCRVERAVDPRDPLRRVQCCRAVGLDQLQPDAVGPAAVEARAERASAVE